MNYAFMSFSCPRATLRDITTLAKELGYTGFEPRVENNHAHGIELSMSVAERKEAKLRLEDTALELCCLAIGSSFVDPETSHAQIDKSLRYLDLAADIGAKRVRVFGGNLPQGMSRDEANDLLISALTQLAVAATEKSLTICLETHDGWCKPHHVAHVMNSVNHAAIAVNWDIMHPIRAGGSSMQEAFEILQPWIKHVHVHDGLSSLETLTMLPMGTGDFDNKEAMRLLKASAYDGFLSGEWIESTMAKPFFASHLTEEIAVLKRYEQDL